jgi:hypothetical protein
MKINFKVTVNGKEYLHPDEVPAELRHLLEDKDNNGIPDMVEQAVKGQSSVNVTMTTSRIFNFNGKEYRSLEEMPPEAQAALKKLNLSSLLNPSPTQAAIEAPSPETSADPQEWLDPNHRGMKAIEPTTDSPLRRFFRRLFG